MSKLRVFVSYSHKDGKWVDKDSAFSLIPWAGREPASGRR